VLAFDIESEEFEIGRGRIYMISLVSEKFRKVLTWKKTKTSQDFVEFVKDEKEMLEKFQDYINELQPDIITGYFSDSFDLPYIRARADKYKIELKFGIADSKIVFSKGKLTNSKITGLSHVDLLKVIETYYSQYLQSETLGLDDVAKELLGDGKKDIDHNNVHNFKEKEWKEFFEYNLHDSILTYNLFQKLWQDMLEFTRIVKEPLAVITRQGMSGLVESYIIHNLERFNEIAEKRPIHEEIQQRRLRQKYEGAFVLQPEADLYENLAIFDFTSYWPSIIVSFNLTYSTFLKHKPEKQANALEVDLGKQGKVYFSKTKGVFPKLLEEIIRLRKKYKQELKEKPDAVKKARSNAFKLLANASYGYQGFFGARYYCPEASAATTAISRGFTKKIIDTMNKNGFKVIYSDTDSIAFLLQDKTKKQTFEFLKKLNDELPGIMELELEDFFTRGIWVTKRTGEFGAKKKYALINEQGKLKIRGFETVRRDWCKLAREVQNKVLELILKEGKYENALKYVQETIKKLKTRKISKDKLIIRTQLKKPIQDYKAETPHVTIAKKMHERGIPADVGMLIQYYVADTGKSKDRVRDKARLPDEKGEYDIEYYTKNQIFPAIENIFDIFKIKEKEILESEQKKIESFFN
ncbi:MAG: DNA-directed DNA polymerase, partial [Nanoarchaeota archaeon]|nr:DNA-directed DNA polymerase [Nanoarchaeota archaeon]